MPVEGATTKMVFQAYLEHVLAPTLSPGQVVVMDNFCAHKGGRVREIVEGRDCELLLYLPPYSPDLNPIQEAFWKDKALLRRAEARTRATLIEAMGRALLAVTASDTRGFFDHCGYRKLANCYDRRFRTFLSFVRPLAIDHPLAGVGRFYGGVHHA